MEQIQLMFFPVAGKCWLLEIRKRFSQCNGLLLPTWQSSRLCTGSRLSAWKVTLRVLWQMELNVITSGMDLPSVGQARREPSDVRTTIALFLPHSLSFCRGHSCITGCSRLPGSSDSAP